MVTKSGDQIVISNPALDSQEAEVFQAEREGWVAVKKYRENNLNKCLMRKSTQGYEVLDLTAGKKDKYLEWWNEWLQHTKGKRWTANALHAQFQRALDRYGETAPENLFSKRLPALVSHARKNGQIKKIGEEQATYGERHGSHTVGIYLTKEI
jgi:hypothetical protein